MTETGYPADPAFQTEPRYQSGPVSHARWMTVAIPPMLRAGVAIVFVTERDSLSGAYASEGILRGADPLTSSPVVSPRPSFYAVRTLAGDFNMAVSDRRPAGGFANAGRLTNRSAF